MSVVNIPVASQDPIARFVRDLQERGMLVERSRARRK